MQQPGDRFYICEMQTNVGLDCGMGHQEEKQPASKTLQCPIGSPSILPSEPPAHLLLQKWGMSLTLNKNRFSITPHSPGFGTEQAKTN